MTTTLKVLFALAIGLGSVPGFVPAAAGDLEAEQPSLSILTEGAAACPVKGGVCLSAGAPATLPVAPLLAAAPGGEGLATDVPRFTRQFPASLPARSAADLVPWTVELEARLRRPAWAGNALFVISDADDPEQAPASRTMTALYQAPIRSGERLSARLRLDPNEGFRPGHTYALRVVQIIEGVEIELAAGEFRLQ